MTEELRIKVEQLKSSFTVEGVPLIHSDKFSPEVLQEIKQNSTCHPSHWFGTTGRCWTDEEIAEQIDTLLSTTIIDEIKIIDILNSLMKKIPYENIDPEKEFIINQLHEILGWNNKVLPNKNFWKKFGSAPFFISENDSNKKLLTFRNLYGACGMNEIFGHDKFSNAYHLLNKISTFKSHFEKIWNENQKKIELSNTVFSSPFNSLDELEENVIVKNIKEEAKKFYLDNTKQFSERVKVFSKYGILKDFIFEPTDLNLNRIFQMYLENDDLDRNITIETPDIIEWWLSYLRTHRCKLNWENPYHPQLNKTNRNRTPSEDTIKRLYRYYVGKLFLEGVGSFIFDW